MEWVLAAVLFIAIIALLIMTKLLKNSSLEISRLENVKRYESTVVRAMLLAALSREIANELIERDPAKYKKDVERLYFKWNKIKAKELKAQQAHFDVITSKYALFADFDELETRPHILYAHAFSGHSDEDLWELYESIRLYDALSCEMDDHWKHIGTGINEGEVEHLREYNKKISDAKLLASLQEASKELPYLQNIGDIDEWVFETNKYKFKLVSHEDKHGWGVYVKSIDRYGFWYEPLLGDSYKIFCASNVNFDEFIYFDDFEIQIRSMKQMY